MNNPTYIEVCEKLCQTYRGIEDKWNTKIVVDESGAANDFQLYCGEELVFSSLDFNNDETECIKNILKIFSQRLIKKASEL